MSISIIIPCYNEEAALPLFYPEFQKLTQQIDNEQFELLLVDDGSRDGTLREIRKLAAADKRVHYISFSRNFGKEAAIYAGLQNAAGDYVAIMDADLQDPPALLPEMYRAITEEGYDSVATRRVTRKGEPVIRSFFAHLFYRIMNKISRTDMVDGARDYRLMNRKFVNALLELGEYNRFTKGLYGWVGFRTKWIEFENVERAAGETKWSFWSLLLYAMDGMVAFSTAPLVLASLMGLVFCLIAFTLIVVVIVKTLVFGDRTSGWPSMICIVMLVSGVQLFCMGILGQYLAKTYLETKKRPVFIIGESALSENMSRNAHPQAGKAQDKGKDVPYGLHI